MVVVFIALRISVFFLPSHSESIFYLLWFLATGFICLCAFQVIINQNYYLIPQFKTTADPVVAKGLSEKTGEHYQIAVLLFYLGVALIFSKGVEIIYGLPTYAYLVFSLPLWIIGLTVVLCYHLILLYKNNRTISYWKKGGFTLVWLCLVACIFQWNYWNFIGFNF